ncbi:hypothetical protein VD0002_g2757 [Verticillium dahliae]|uniref:Uncharacterized protein n=2 Tax=Verticillium TaxID=1036719 RepID=A0AA44WGE0_VERDA|nr:hypothetical protein BJF96_g5414 [Verticillium dahliae]PNH52810.1 hypothetical protein VD0003_g4535 [Verticillium dahliae]PNH66658.1 hypothetical protein VD0002_g2757 [Verticillium dahliae]
MIIPSPAASCTTGHVLMARSPAWLFPGCHPDPVALSASHPLQQIWSSPTEWYSEPHIVATFMIWVATFAMASIVVLGVAFGFVGFSAGVAVAAFQSYMYNGYAPSGGILSTTASITMLGVVLPWGLGVASVFATLAAAVSWAYRPGI